MQATIYALLIRLYGIGILLASPFHPKARRWVQGRRHWAAKLTPPLQNNCITWIHCASTGEYEQAKPIIRAIKAEHPQSYILVSYFSPSGYDAFVPNDIVDQICYLPLDTADQANTFIDIIRPKVAIFIKYELWHNFLTALTNRSIPIYLISARFYNGHILFKPYMKFLRKSAQSIHTIFVQDQKSFDLLKKHDFNNVQLAGDTRLEQVIANKAQPYSDPLLDHITANRLCLVAGSTWPDDDTLLRSFALRHPDYTIILAPHEYNASKLNHLLHHFGTRATLYSELADHRDAQIIIVDRMGILKYIYRYADIGYIGGGFANGIHNILEAAIYNIPIFFGPNHDGFLEATDMINLKIATVINSDKDIRLPRQPSFYQKAMESYIKAHPINSLKITKQIISNCT